NTTDLRDGPERTTLLYRPGTNTWSSMATQALNRTYHSTALLLPDARAVSAGDNGPEGGAPQLEIYSPPHLLAAARPTTPVAPSPMAGRSWSGRQERTGSAGRS